MTKKLIILAFALLSAFAVYADNQDKVKYPPTVYMVANAHFDTQWRWDAKQSIGEFIPNTLYQNFYLFETYPEYLFNFEGGIKYAWMKEYYPEQFKRVKKYVEEGRWNIAGSSWDANDPNMPSPESFIRNILYGQEFYKREFNKKANDIMLPDCFGFGYTLPTIASHCGVEYFHTQKLEWRAKPFYENGWKIPFHFGWWEGAGGAKLLAVMDGGDYSWDPETYDFTDDNDFRYRLRKSPVNAVYRYFGTKSSHYEGDRGGSPRILTVESIRRAANNPKDYQVRFAKVNDMFDTYRDYPELPTFNGELLMDIHATGCYSSVAQMKNLNRRNEQMAGAAEGASVMADWFGGVKYPHYTIDEAWKRIIWHQFHDDLTGTSIPEAYRYSYNDEYLSLNQFDNVVRTGMMSVASAMNTDVKGAPVIVYNPISTVNRTPVEVEYVLPFGMNDVTVYDKGGKRMKSQIVKRQANVVTVLFESEAAPMSLSVYEIRPVKKAGAQTTSLKVGENTIENGIYRLVLDKNGDIASLVDKRCGKELVKKGEAFSLALFGNNKSYSWPAWEIIKKVLDQKPVTATENVAVSISENGPLRASIKVERTFGDTRFVQEYTMTDGATDERIDVRMYIDWKSKATLLKVAFPVSFDAKNATYDLGIANISRGNNTEIAYETYGHQWADITADDGSYGVTIMNDCKYGWDKPNDNTLRLTLLHTPETGGWCANQATQDIGEHTLTYSIVGHQGPLSSAQAAAVSDALNQKKIAYLAHKHKGTIGKEFVMVSTDNPAIRVKALKKAQDGEGIVVRTYELSGNAASGKITFPANILSAVEVNGIEETIGEASFSGNTLNVEVAGFEPKSYRVQLAAPSNPIKPAEYENLALPYNEKAITSDAFSSFGHMDDAWHSYAGELVPEKLDFNGVTFQLGKADYWNALTCKGQVLDLPEGTTKVAMLVASSDGDRTAEFNAGTHVSLDIPYYSGSYGCYGWEGYYDSFLKTGDVAYIGTHRHDASTRNEIMVYTYMYYVELPVEKGCTALRLPSDRHVTIFAATAVK
ncbi:MAG: alpha-mannosidase [Bacteroidales bacterium]|nr:alpha-mannosidase [Bacteroidales bacterium]